MLYRLMHPAEKLFIVIPRFFSTLGGGGKTITIVTIVFGNSVEWDSLGDRKVKFCLVTFGYLGKGLG